MAIISYTASLTLQNGNTELFSAEYIGGGIFLTAAHPFDFYQKQQSGNAEPPIYNEFYADSNQGIPDIDNNMFLTYHLLRDWKPVWSQAPDINVSANDLAYIAPISMSNVPDVANPSILFADQEAVASYLSGKSLDFSGDFSTLDNAGTFGTVSAPGQFTISISTVSGDSGGAATLQVNGNQYIVGILSASNSDVVPQPTIVTSLFSYLTPTDYRNATKNVQSGYLPLSGVPNIVVGQASGDIIVGNAQVSDDLIEGNDCVVSCGTGGDLINTETGKNDVVFLPDAQGQSDPGTTVVVSPGITTLVGGGASDKLVLLADRLGDDNGQQAGANAPSDASDTIQLLGGWNPYGDSQDGTSAYYEASDPSGSADYYVKYLQRGSDLYVSVTDYDTGGEANGLVDGVIWDSEVVIKDFVQGDYGLNFTTSDDLNLLYDGTESDDQFNANEKRAMASLTASPQEADQVDDDADVGWRGQAPLATVCGEPIFQFAPVSDVTIAADLQAVLSDDGGDPSPSDPQGADAPTAPTIAGATPGQATAAEASAAPFGGMAITDGSPGADDTVTIMQLGGEGVLAGAGLTANPDGTYTLAAADAATVTAELQALTFTPDAGAAGTKPTTILTVTDRSSAGGSATDTTTTVTDISAGPPLSSVAIGGTQAWQTTADLAVMPFAGVTATLRAARQEGWAPVKLPAGQSFDPRPGSFCRARDDDGTSCPGLGPPNHRLAPAGERQVVGPMQPRSRYRPCRETDDRRSNRWVLKAHRSR